MRKITASSIYKPHHFKAALPIILFKLKKRADPPPRFERRRNEKSVNNKSCKHWGLTYFCPRPQTKEHLGGVGEGICTGVTKDGDRLTCLIDPELPDDNVVNNRLDFAPGVVVA